MGRLIDLTGKTYGQWIVEKRHGKDKDNKITWLCTCQCGTTRVVSGKSLRSGRSKSCGCYNHSLGTEKHNMRNHPEYGVWKAMRTRCNNPNADNYIHYGGRGIKVCERWDDFSTFYKDMGKRPSEKHSIDRIDVNKDYEPSNCRWAIQTQQVRNTRLRHDNKSGERGVYLNDKLSKWESYITVDKKRIHLGFHESKEDAVKSRREAEDKYWNEVT